MSRLSVSPHGPHSLSSLPTENSSLAKLGKQEWRGEKPEQGCGELHLEKMAGVKERLLLFSLIP